MNAVVGTLLVMVVHRLSLRAVTVNRARIAAAITALHPGLIAYSAVLMSELLCALLVLAGVWIASRSLRWSSMLLAGILFGLAALVRPSSLLAAPLVAVLLPLPKLDALFRGAVVSAVAVATLLPWTARNCRVMDGCALVSTNGGWNLAIGALTPTGRFHALHGSDGCPVVTGQVQQDRCWAEVGAETIASDPVHWLELVPKKLEQTYDHESFPIEYLREADPDGWPESRRVAGRALLTVFHQILLVVAALGLVSLPSPRRIGGLGAVVQTALLLSILGFAVRAAYVGRSSVLAPRGGDSDPRSRVVARRTTGFAGRTISSGMDLRHHADARRIFRRRSLSSRRDAGADDPGRRSAPAARCASSRRRGQREPRSVRRCFLVHLRPRSRRLSSPRAGVTAPPRRAA